MKKHVKYCTTLSLTVLLLLSGAGCHVEKKIAAAELSSGYARQATEMVPLTDEFKNAMANFSITLFQKTVTKDVRNDLVSPLSAATCLALVNNGANGNTRAQIEALFGMQTEELNRYLYSYTQNLYTGKNCEVTIANSIWFRESKLFCKDFP
jgi:serpin B